MITDNNDNDDINNDKNNNDKDDCDKVIYNKGKNDNNILRLDELFNENLSCEFINLPNPQKITNSIPWKTLYDDPRNCYFHKT